MRKIEFSELKLKKNYSEEDFYNVYLQSSEPSYKKNNLIEEPTKKYEVCLLNILGGIAELSPILSVNASWSNTISPLTALMNGMVFNASFSAAEYASESSSSDLE